MFSPKRIQSYRFVSSFIEMTVLRRALRVWVKCRNKVSVPWSLPEDGQTLCQGRDGWPAIQRVLTEDSIPLRRCRCSLVLPRRCAGECLAGVLEGEAAVLVLPSSDHCCGVSGHGRVPLVGRLNASWILEGMTGISLVGSFWSI